MKIEIIAHDAHPTQGGYGTRVQSHTKVFSQFADVRLVLTDRPRGPRTPGVEYVTEPVRDTLLSKLRRLNTYYKTDFPRRDIRDPPDLTIVESLDLVGMHQYGAAVPMVLHEANVHWELQRYEMINSPFFKTWLGRRKLVRRRLVSRLQDRAKAFEINAVRRATRTLVSSARDRDLLLSELPEQEGRIHVLPNCLDKEEIRPSDHAADTKNVLFVGGYNYIPNQEAAMFVAEKLAPALPDASFFLVGSHPPPEAARPANVVAPGYVEDLQPMLDTAAICIAPLMHGSGTRFKILTYLAAGRAVVATTKACEGLEVEDNVHLLLRDDPESFESAIRTLLEDPDLRRRLGNSGRALLESTYDWRVYVEPMRDLVTEIVGVS